MRRARLLYLLILVVSFGAVRAAPPTPATTASLGTPPRSIPLPGGLTDAAARTGFFASASGGIDAVDLKTGDLLWETSEAQRPLLVVGSRLIAQAGVKRNRLRILIFEIPTGECVLESEPVVLPGWVVTGDGPGRSFDTHWRLEKNQFVLGWEAAAWYAGIARPTPQQESSARRHATGMVRVDLGTGQVEVGAAEHATSEPPAAPPKELEKLAVRWQGVVGNHTCAVVLEESAGGQSLVLRAWDRSTGKAVEPRELLHGTRLRTQPTLDGHFLCLRDAGNTPDDKALGKGGKDAFWTLFSLDLGAAVARLPYEPGTQSITVLGGRVYYAVSGTVRGALDRPLVQPRTLKAVELKSGKVLWERAVAGKQLTPPTR